MIDPTEDFRREMFEDLRQNPKTREQLEEVYGRGKVWDTAELQEKFKVLGFLAPFCEVVEKETGRDGLVMFQPNPRFYFGFVPA